jgi:cytochrome oxidase Cu insertion factor (SCO1/SenC/PrrC family)
VRWLVAVSVAVVALGAAGLVHLARSTPRTEPAPPPRFTAAATWAAGAYRAPSFALHDEKGAPVTLAALRGRPVVVTFMDPVCKDLCPLEARVLGAAIRKLPADQRPVVVAVSVNPPADTAANFARDSVRWQLGPQWRWAVGSRKQLAPVWRAYRVDVQPSSDGEVAHTEAAYIVDKHGDARAVYVYPFAAADFAQSLRDTAGD